MNTENHIISISKEQLAELPIVTYNGAITLVDSVAEECAALRALSKEKIVGFDTETRPAFHKGQQHKVALMQISTADRCFLFRLNKLGLSDRLRAFLENPDIIKIGLSVHDDFSVLRRSDQTLNPQGFVDLQSMMSHYRITDISLQKIYAIIFGEKISKNQRLTNWEAKELTAGQQAYAALDAWACLKIYLYLTAGCFNPATSQYLHAPEVIDTNHNSSNKR